MRRAHGVVAALGLLVATVLPACDRGGGGGAGGTDTTAVVVDSLDPICADSTIHHLCPVIPHEVVVQVLAGYTGLDTKVQPKFDMFSWQSFVALNWPANPDGTPLPTFDGNPGAPRVWETYLDATQVYTTTQGNLPCNVGPGGKFLGQMAKNGDVVDPGGDYDEAVGGPLADVNVNYVVYEKKINPDEVGYLRAHRLNTIPGQMAADSADTALVFIAGRDRGPVGSIELKAAWRVMMPGDDTTTFYHRSGVIYVPARNSATGRDMCLNVTVGLIGLHIIHKTSQFGDWIWSTFEHEANAPTCTDSAGGGSCGGDRPRWSLYNAACTSCVPNDTMKLRAGDTTFLWQPSPPYAGLYAQQGKYGVQVTRTQPIPDYTERVNTTWTGRVQNTVWRHYRLIGSQWMSGELSHVPVPTLLRNTALETYLPTNSSCLGCHQYAHTLSNAQGDSVFSDFSFLLTMANRTRGFEMLPPRIVQSAGARPGNQPFRHPTTEIIPNLRRRPNAPAAPGAAPGAAPAPAPSTAPAAAPPPPPPASPRR